MPPQAHQGRVAGRHWDPQQYLKFADHRLRPALELLERIPLTAPQVIYDLGCGAGNVTRLLANHWPEAAVYGVDSSPEMLAKAAAEPSSIHWAEANIQDWLPPQPPDLIYSNATLQWLDGHQTLFPRLLHCLNPGGCLAVQVPLSWGMPPHRLMRETLADSGPGGQPLGDTTLRTAVARKWVEDAEVYYDLLAASTASLDIWETEYLQVLTGQEAVLEWVKSTGLRPILTGLPESEREVFLTAYRQRLDTLYPRRADGHTLYPFRRLFIVAVKA